MNNPRNFISVVSLSYLASLSGRVEAALEDIRDTSDPAFLNVLRDFFAAFHFDSSSLVWMAIGGAFVAAGILLRSRGAPAAQQKRMPEMQPVSDPAAVNDKQPEQRPAGEGEDTYLAQSWMSLDEATTVTVEEMSSVEEEAEVFMMIGRPDMAIKILRDHLDAEPNSSAYVWFKLLDIYHVQDMREPFDLLAQEIRKHFNVELPSWDASRAAAEARQGLEHFPNLLSKISQHWNDPAGLEYLQSLMHDNRKGERTGFNEEAFKDMLLLSDVLAEKMAESATGAGSGT